MRVEEMVAAKMSLGAISVLDRNLLEENQPLLPYDLGMNLNKARSFRPTVSGKDINRKPPPHGRSRESTTSSWQLFPLAEARWPLPAEV
jgi:hypothetical protein